MLEPGARCKVKGLSAQLELNGIFVRLLELTHSSTGPVQVPRWKVITDEGFGKEFLIRPQNLEICETWDSDESEKHHGVGPPACSVEEANEVRMDIITGEAWSYSAFYAFYAQSTRYKPEELRKYWLSRCRPVEEWPDEHEQRIDPVQGFAVKFREFCSKHAGVYSHSHIRDYWLSLRRPELNIDTNPGLAAEKHVDNSSGYAEEKQVDNSSRYAAEKQVDSSSGYPAEKQVLSPGFAGRAARRAAAVALQNHSVNHAEEDSVTSTRQTSPQCQPAHSQEALTSPNGVDAASGAWEGSIESPTQSKRIADSGASSPITAKLQEVKFQARGRSLDGMNTTSRACEGSMESNATPLKGAALSPITAKLQMDKFQARARYLAAARSSGTGIVTSKLQEMSSPSVKRVSESNAFMENSPLKRSPLGSIENTSSRIIGAKQGIQYSLQKDNQGSWKNSDGYEFEACSTSSRGTVMRSIPQTSGWGLLYLR
eukprot:gnl/MRDRNA2_/MRDRNA2_27036_c0_seq1.p1 gnl/MRDRNA2_/MRDRNA2_27036_c0~~gnl/MRDRNA2_/MRDRNA2_27036_c0_seq1.p1  ORF type:complete len:485 (-),score=102.21 gnl/MRDRNA2_/MRDRNA2_27036_c0_seq1:277-1731(-)